MKYKRLTEMAKFQIGSLMLHASHVFEICAFFMTKRRKNLGKIKTVVLNDVLQTFGKKT